MAEQQAASFRVGVDENGLGPKLGPLIVTAAMAKVGPGGEAALAPGHDAALDARLGDSKLLVSHGHVKLGEAWARAVVLRGAGRQPDASTPAALLDALSLDDPESLEALCPTRADGARVARAQCWDTEGESSSDDLRFLRLLAQVQGDLGRLAEHEVDVVAVRTIVLCCHRLNQAALAGTSRLLVDLHAMERLVLAMRELAACEITAVCGKVGAVGDYAKVLGPLGDRPHTAIERGRRRSAYRVAGVGEVSFVQDAEQTDLLVGLASLVGKYLRELCMARMTRFYQRQDPSLPSASGYGDPVTARFVARTARRREALGVPLDCFQRRRRTKHAG